MTKECEGPSCTNTFWVEKKPGRPRKYCSRACGQQAVRLKHGRKSTKVGDTVTTVCTGCQEEFSYTFKGSYRTFHSEYCMRRHHENKRRYNRRQGGVRQRSVLHDEVCGCGRDYLSIPLDDQHLGCPTPKVPRPDVQTPLSLLSD